MGLLGIIFSQFIFQNLGVDESFMRAYTGLTADSLEKKAATEGRRRMYHAVAPPHAGQHQAAHHGQQQVPPHGQPQSLPHGQQQPLQPNQAVLRIAISAEDQARAGAYLAPAMALTAPTAPTALTSTTAIVTTRLLAFERIYNMCNSNISSQLATERIEIMTEIWDEFYE